MLCGVHVKVFDLEVLLVTLRECGREGERDYGEEREGRRYR